MTSSAGAGPPGSFAWTGDVHGEDRCHHDRAFDWLTGAVGVHAWSYLDHLGKLTEKLYDALAH